MDLANWALPGLHRISSQGLNISSIGIFDQIRDPEIPITLSPYTLKFFFFMVAIMKLNRSVEKGTKSYFTSFQEGKKTSSYLKYFTKYIQFCFVCYMMGHECYPLIILIYVNRKLR